MKRRYDRHANYVVTRTESTGTRSRRMFTARGVIRNAENVKISRATRAHRSVGQAHGWSRDTSPRDSHARVGAARRPPGAYPKVLNRFSRREASLRRAGRRVARGGRFDSLIPIRSSRTSAAGDDAKAYRATWRKPASRGRFRRRPRDPRRLERSCVKRERRGACWNARRKRAKPNSGEAKTILHET